MQLNKGKLLWSKSLKNTTLKEILNFIIKTEFTGILLISDDSFLIIDKKRVIAAQYEEKKGDHALVDLFEALKTEDEIFFYSIDDIDLVKKKNPEIFLKNPEKALISYLRSNPEMFRDIIERIEKKTKLSREEIMAKYKIREPSDGELSIVLSPFESKKKKAKLKDFKEFIDVVYGRR